METTKLEAEVRAERGKGSARRLRAAGKLPAVFYGPGHEPQPIAIDPTALTHHLRGAYGRNTLFSLSLSGQEQLAMVRDLSVDPVKRDLIHVDFYAVSLDRAIKTEIPIRTVGRSVGVVKGGKLHVTRRTLPIRCTPDKIPAEILLDVTELDVFGTLDVKDVTLPEGVEATLDGKRTLARVEEDRRAAREAKAAAEK